MDKSKALERLTALETEAQELRKIIEAPEIKPMPPSLLTKPRPGSREKYYCMSSEGSEYRKLDVYDLMATVTSPGWYEHGNLFQTRQLANDYAEAFDTFLLLRHQPGTVPPTGYSQFALELFKNYDYDRDERQERGEVFIKIISRANMSSKLNKFSPMFGTLEDARGAIETIGEERLIHMFKTFHHID